MLRWMITNDYEEPRTVERRAVCMGEWVKNRKLMEADEDA